MERERESSHLLVHFPNSCMTWDWVKPVLGARNSTQTTHVGDRMLHLSHQLPSPKIHQHAARLEVEKPGLNRTHFGMGRECSKWWLNSLCHHTQPKVEFLKGKRGLVGDMSSFLCLALWVIPVVVSGLGLV